MDFGTRCWGNVSKEVLFMDAKTALSLFNKELLSYETPNPGNDLFYYSLPYERNYDLTRSIPLAPVSGNVIKFYQYRIDKPVVIFTDIVDTTAEDVSDHDSEEFSEDEYDGSSLADQFYDEEGNLREDLTEEEMAALLTASSSSSLSSDSDEESYDDEAFEENASGEEESSEDSYGDEAYDKEPASAASDDYDDYDDDEAYDKEPSSWDAPEF